MEKLEVPQELRDYDHVLKMLTIVFPCTSKTIRVDDYKNDRAKMVAVFRENTHNICAKYFELLPKALLFLLPHQWILGVEELSNNIDHQDLGG